jgi:hypothetical protein
LNSTPSGRTGYLVSGAVLLGCGVIAAAIYLRPAAPPPSAPSVSSSEAQAAPSVAAVTTPAATAAPPAAPSEVHTAARFRTIWQEHARAAAEACQPDKKLGTRPDTRHLELAMKLTIDADGRVSEAKLAGEARDVADDGTYRKPKAAGVAELGACYAKYIQGSVRFPPATGSSQLDVYVRMLDTGR